MEIISWNFLLFITVVLLVYYLLNRQAQNYWLLTASAFFVCTHGWPHLIPLLIMAGVTFQIGKRLEASTDKRWLAASVSINTAAFVIYRIVNSPLVTGTGQMALSDPHSILHSVLIPLGFAFYTLQAIGYLIDVYKSKIRAETSRVDFLVYLMFFPKILAGPIERAGNFLPLLKTERIVDNRKAARGSMLILFGLFRKIAIAEVLLTLIPGNFLHTTVENAPMAIGLIPIPFLASVETVANADRLIGILAYGIYLYNDFAGYTGIMRGISLLMGIDLSPNFRQPYFSTSLAEFWSHWHISLSSWLRDYLYFPLTRYWKKRYNQPFALIPIILPLLVTMLIAGFWHGLTAPFLLWGLIYGTVMALEQIAFQRWPALRPPYKSLPAKVMAALLTFSIVTLAWVPFAAGSFREILTFWQALWQGSGWQTPPDFSYWILVLVFASFLLDFLQSRDNDETFLLEWPLPARASILAAIILVLFLAFTWTAPYTSNVFIYQNF